MSSLKTKYLGLEIKNPIIVGASNMANDLDSLKKLEDAGAAAVVYKSLFEEQIQLESMQLQEDIDEYSERNAEMISLFPNVEHAGPEEHLLNLRKAKESLNIPVIASLNAIYRESWIEYAELIQETGVDALELNFYAVPRDIKISGSDIEKEQIETLKAVKAKVKIPVSVKLSPFYANPLNLIAEMDKTGVNGFILFNRLFQPDINAENETHHTPFNLSNPDDNRLSLRFAGLLYNNIKADIICNTGIYNGIDVVKSILAGASSVQVVSTVYKNKIEYISKIISDVENWMKSKNYSSIDDFRGKLSKDKIVDPFIYKRAQYIDLLINSGEIMKSYKLR